VREVRTAAVVLASLGLTLTLGDGPASAQRTEPGPGLGVRGFISTLVAGPLEGGGFWQCNVLNLGNHPLQVTVELRDSQGDEHPVDPDSQTCDEPVLPGHVCHGPRFGTQGKFYCAVRFLGVPSAVRATLQLTNTDGHSLSAEAR